MKNLLLNLGDTATKVNSILSEIVGPIMIALGGAMGVYIVVLGVQYAKSENDNKRAEAKTRMVNCLIGLFVAIVMAVLCMAVKWDALVTQIYDYF